MQTKIDPKGNVWPVPEPRSDWLNQQDLAKLLGCSAKHACLMAKEGLLKCYEHGCEVAGRRKYSRFLVLRDIAEKFRAGQQPGDSREFEAPDRRG